MIIKTRKFTASKTNPYLMDSEPYTVKGEISDQNRGYITIEDEELGVKLRLDAFEIVKFFKDEWAVEFESSDDGYGYYCPVCGEYFSKRDVADFDYCPSCGVGIYW